jgi:hypothetical protein
MTRWMSLTSSRPPPAPPAPNPVPPTPPSKPDPTDADIRSNRKSIAKDTCLFYAKVGSEDDVKAKRDERGLSGYVILKDTWLNRDYTRNTINGMSGRGTRGQRFFSRASRVLAEDCSGTVYVFLQPGSGTNWPELAGTIWAKDEWPALVANGKVDKVIRLDWTDANKKQAIKGSLSKRTVATTIEARDSNDKCTLSPEYKVFGHLNARLPGVLRCR